MNNLLQAAGLLLFVAGTWFVWPPLPLLVVGLALIVVPEVRERSNRGGGES